MKNPSNFERQILEFEPWLDAKSRENWLRSMPPHIKDQYEGINNEGQSYYDNVFGGPGANILSTRIVLNNMNSPYLNVENGCRHTASQPSDYDNKILVFGASNVFSYGSEDKHTICSYLQELLNKNQTNGKTYKVENHGLRGAAILTWLNNLMHQKIEPGDIAIVWSQVQFPKVICDEIGVESQHISLSRPHDLGEIFIDHSHVGPKGNQAFAKRIFSNLNFETSGQLAPKDSDDYAAENCFFLQRSFLFQTYKKQYEAQGLSEYERYLNEIKVSGHKSYGSVAVNCNPFTRGHLHLLEYAARQVDFLYVFVIEEDMSFFPFEYRKEMVEQGLKHLKNVKVINGGRYICTYITFPEYYNKKEANSVPADASVAAWFFAQHIAPVLDIKNIYLGNEPLCANINKYNAKMADILPDYGVNVNIIERIEQNGEVISASRVRRFLSERNFEEIRKIVPETTSSFLEKHY